MKDIEKKLNRILNGYGTLREDRKAILKLFLDRDERLKTEVLRLKIKYDLNEINSPDYVSEIEKIFKGEQ